jgi:AcrR family transcriptional regulator
MPRIVKDPEERRQEIIAAARELFQTKEYDKATMRDVMEMLGIAKGTIYHYFRSKEALLEAVVENIVEENIAHLQAQLDESTGSALDRFRVLVTSGSIADSEEEIMEQLHRPGNIGMHTRLLAVTISRMAPLYAQVIEQGCEEGIFQTDHPLECAEFLLAGVQFLTDMGIFPWEQEDLIRRAMAFPAMVEAQLKAPPGTFDFLLEQLS